MTDSKTITTEQAKANPYLDALSMLDFMFGESADDAVFFKIGDHVTVMYDEDEGLRVIEDGEEPVDFDETHAQAISEGIEKMRRYFKEMAEKFNP